MKISKLIFLFVFLPIILVSAQDNSAERAYLEGDYSTAIEIANQRWVNEKDDAALYLLGLCYIKLGDYSQARDYLRILLRDFSISRYYQEAMVKFVDTYFWESDYAKAKALYKNILEDYPNHSWKPHLYLRIAQCSAKQGNWDEERVYIQKLKSEYPDSAERKFADVLEQRGYFFTIQVGAFSDRYNANNLFNSLKKKGYSVYIVQEPKESYTLYKVRVGKYYTRDEVEKVYQSLIKNNYPATIYP